MTPIFDASGLCHDVDAAPKGELLLFHPPVYNDRRAQWTHGAWMRIGRIGDTPLRPPTAWRPLPEAPEPRR